jgi:uncharacterized protein YjiS (DUF1127 family)
MRTASESSIFSAIEDDVLGSVAACTDTPLLVTARRAFADYDAANDRGPVASAARPGSYELHLAARAQRASAIGKMIVAAIRGTVAFVRRARAHVPERRQARLNEDNLRRLGDHALRDLGLTRIDLSRASLDPLQDLRTRV